MKAASASARPRRGFGLAKHQAGHGLNNRQVGHGLNRHQAGHGLNGHQAGHGLTHRQTGFGLVEMMVALALGLLVVGGASVLFLSTRQANASSDNLSRMQESVRTSHDMMTREVREAGGTPCDAQLLVANVLNNAQGAAPTWWASWNEPMRGFDGSTALDAAAFGTNVADRVAGTAALVVRYGAAIDNLAITAHDATNAVFTTNVVNHGIAAGDTLVVCNYRQASIFQASSANTGNGTFAHAGGGTSPGNCSTGLGIPTACTSGGTTYQYAAGALVGRLNTVAWYVGNNGHPETGGRSLYRVTRLGPEEVAEGVRDMQLGYLLAGGSNYVAASAVADWSQVVAVRLDVNHESADANAFTNGAGQRLVRPVSFTVNLRNLQP